jgi:hypothetical protein
LAGNGDQYSARQDSESWILSTPHPEFTRLKPRVFLEAEFLTHFEVQWFPALSTDGGWIAKMAFFHGHPAATATDIFHSA